MVDPRLKLFLSSTLRGGGAHPRQEPHDEDAHQDAEEDGGAHQVAEVECRPRQWPRPLGPTFGGGGASTPPFKWVAMAATDSVREPRGAYPPGPKLAICSSHPPTQIPPAIGRKPFEIRFLAGLD